MATSVSYATPSGMYAGGVARRKLYRVDMAELAGINIRSLGRANLPEPDGHDMERGHARPYWWEPTANEWLASRRGKGWRKGLRKGVTSPPE